jgi:hypothetical protein
MVLRNFRNSTAVEIVLSDEERSVLESWTSRHKTAQALALRARIVLAAAGQLTNREIAVVMITRSTCSSVIVRGRPESARSGPALGSGTSPVPKHRTN